MTAHCECGVQNAHLNRLGSPVHTKRHILIVSIKSGSRLHSILLKTVGDVAGCDFQFLCAGIAPQKFIRSEKIDIKCYITFQTALFNLLRGCGLRCNSKRSKREGEDNSEKYTFHKQDGEFQVNFLRVYFNVWRFHLRNTD